MKALLVLLATTAVAENPSSALFHRCTGFTFVIESKPVLSVTKKESPDGPECIIDKVILDLDALLDKAEVKLSPENAKKLGIMPQWEGIKPRYDYCFGGTPPAFKEGQICCTAGVCSPTGGVPRKGL